MLFGSGSSINGVVLLTIVCIHRRIDLAVIPLVRWYTGTIRPVCIDSLSNNSHSGFEIVFFPKYTSTRPDI